MVLDHLLSVSLNKYVRRFIRTYSISHNDEGLEQAIFGGAPCLAMERTPMCHDLWVQWTALCSIRSLWDYFFYIKIPLDMGFNNATIVVFVRAELTELWVIACIVSITKCGKGDVNFMSVKKTKKHTKTQKKRHVRIDAGPK